MTFDEIYSFFKDVGTKIKFKKGTHYSVAEKIYQQYISNVAMIRLEVYEAMSKDALLNNKIHEACEDDFVFWCNLFGWTYNPLYDGKERTPFVLFQYQVDFFRIIQNNKRVIVIKPRGMGFTWLKAFINIWRMLYRKLRGIVISRVEEDLDLSNDRHQTIFGRMRFILENLPYKVNYQSSYKTLIIGNNQYLGKSSNKDAARSGRGELVEIEEAGVIQNLTLIMRAVNSLAKRIIIGGSVTSDNNGFYDYWESKQSNYFHVFWEYWMNPLYACDGWLEEAEAGYGDDKDGFKQEILVDFFATLSGVVFKNFSFIKKISSLPTGSYLRKMTGIDPGFGSSPTGIWFAYFDVDKQNIYYVGYKELKNSTIDEIVDEITRRGFLEADHFIDEHAHKRDSEGKTLAIRFASKGMQVILVDNKGITNSCKYSNDLMKDGKIFFLENGEGLDIGEKKIKKYKYAKTGDKQEKDENSDAGDAFRYSHACFTTYTNIADMPKINRFMVGEQTKFQKVRLKDAR